jgi:hypothetical protein
MRPAVSARDGAEYMMGHRGYFISASAADDQPYRVVGEWTFATGRYGFSSGQKPRRRIVPGSGTVPLTLVIHEA